MSSILAVGLLLIIGFFGGFLARKIKLPTISGYIIIGMGLSLFNIIPKELVNGDLSIIVEISLGIIGYLVGGTLNFGILKRYGKQIILITSTQLVGAWILVTVLIAFLGPFLIKFSIPNPSKLLSNLFASRDNNWCNLLCYCPSSHYSHNSGV